MSNELKDNDCRGCGKGLEAGIIISNGWGYPWHEKCWFKALREIEEANNLSKSTT